MRLRHVGTNLLNERQDDESGHSVRDEGGNHEDQRRKDNENPVNTHIGNVIRDPLRDGVEKTGGAHGTAERQPSCREDDDRPQKVVEVLFRQDPCAEEQNHRDDCNHTHVSKDALQLMRGAPECDSQEGDKNDEVLNSVEFVFHGSDRDDGYASAGFKCYQEEEPDKDDADDADWKRDKEPDSPAGIWLHVL